MEVGRGIHVIDNAVSAKAKRIGFITINGSSQISIKGNMLYCNSYDDLVVVDMTDTADIKEISRIKGAFPKAGAIIFSPSPLKPVIMNVHPMTV